MSTTSMQMTDPFEASEIGRKYGRNASDDDNDAINERRDSADQASSAGELHATPTSSTGRSLLNYINSGPMSEGHVRLYSSTSQPSDPSQNICLFTLCLFLVGCAVLSIGITLYARHKLVLIGVFLIILGSFSAGSSVLYTLLYVFMFGLRHGRSRNRPVSRSGRGKPSNYEAERSSAVNGNANGIGFEQFSNIETITQTNGAVHNGELDLVNEGSGLCGSTYVPPPSDAVQLNVDSLDFEIKSTQNLDVSAWRTINGDLPQSYLESFGELPSDLLSSPSLKQGLEGFSGRMKRRSNQKSKKRSIFDSLRNGTQAFAIKAHQKSDSQTELLDSENGDEGENTLFHIESIGQELENQAAGGSGGTVTVENGGHNAPIVVHFNRKNNNDNSIL